MKTYEINEDTYAIVPKSKEKTYVYEKNGTYLINESADQIMEDSCEYFGSTFNGRREGAAKVLNSSYKVPIIVEDSESIIFFPTESPRLASCSWISLKNIDYYQRYEDGSIIVFKDGSLIKLPISYTSLNNQILRSSRLQYLISKRKSKKTEKNTKKSA